MSHKPDKAKMIANIRTILSKNIGKTLIQHEWNEEWDEDVLVVKDEAALATELYKFFDKLQDALNERYAQLLEKQFEELFKGLGVDWKGLSTNDGENLIKDLL